MIRQQLLSWDTGIFDQYLSQYHEQLERFVKSMTTACHAWEGFDKTIQGDEERAHISSLIFRTISLHLLSTKLLIWGCLIPAGHTMRQVLETISMAFLASKPRLGFLDRYSSGQYSTNRAVRDVLKNADKLNLTREALETLQEAHKFYNKLSHPTLLTMATYIERKGGSTYFGASFDPGKQFAYDKEINTRAQVAALLENMIQGIRLNLGG
jgi:hypothetical protein